MPISFRNKRHRRRIRELKKQGLSGRQARRLARKENTARNGKFGKRLFRGVKKVAPFALGAVGLGLATGVIGKGLLGKGILGKLGKGKALRLAKRSARKARRLSGSGKSLNFATRLFKNRRKIRSEIKSVQDAGLSRKVTGVVKYSPSVPRVKTSFSIKKPIPASTVNSFLTKTAAVAASVPALSAVFKKSSTPVSPLTVGPSQIKSSPSNPSKPSWSATLGAAIKSKVDRVVKPHSPSGDSVADTLQSANQIYDTVKPFLPPSVAKVVDEKVGQVKQAVIKSEVQTQSDKVGSFLQKNASMLLMAGLGLLVWRKMK